jgi:ribosomal protein S27AE
MSSGVFFQIRPTRRSNPESRTTLDALHNHQLESFSKEKETIEDLKARKELVQNQIDGSADDIKISRFEVEVRDLDKKINHLSQNKEVFDYFLSTGDLLFQYYDIQDKIASSAPTSQSIVKHQQKAAPGSILSFLESAAQEEKSDVIRTTMTSQSANKVYARDDLLDKYLQKIDPGHSRAYNTILDDKSHVCPKCEGDMILCPTEAILSCGMCGHMESILIDSDKPSYKDPPREVSYYAYKRINHFNECLAQFQAKQSTEIPDEIFNEILKELKKQRITNYATLKQTKIREILKKLGYPRLYEHTAHILNRLNGNSQVVPTMTREQEEKLRFLFREIQPCFQKHIPKYRSNFLSYHYFLYKMCELLELDEFLPSFSLLKNRDKLYDHDRVWQQICKDMGWQFIRTV